MKKILLILISVITLNSQSMAYEEANYEVVKENKWGVGQMGKLNHKTNKRLSILKDK